MPIEHPAPSDATVKELYANASGCANPQCEAPLYRVNSDDTRTLNSRVAHIRARRENGPRWDPEMSSEKNRSVGNLLLMCIPHSYEVNDPQRVHLYPEELLLSWKEQQLAQYDRTRNGWQITDAEAEEVIRESDAAEIIIQGDTINLGAQGGQAPSAGGAGGTAIGRGAISGKGGQEDQSPSTWAGALAKLQELVAAANLRSIPSLNSCGAGPDEHRPLASLNTWVWMVRQVATQLFQMPKETFSCGPRVASRR